MSQRHLCPMGPHLVMVEPWILRNALCHNVVVSVMRPWCVYIRPLVPWDSLATEGPPRSHEALLCIIGAIILLRLFMSQWHVSLDAPLAQSRALDPWDSTVSQCSPLFHKSLVCLQLTLVSMIFHCISYLLGSVKPSCVTGRLGSMRFQCVTMIWLPWGPAVFKNDTRFPKIPWCYCALLWFISLSCVTMDTCFCEAWKCPSGIGFPWSHPRSK